MFIIYFNLTAMYVVFSRDDADAWIREQCAQNGVADVDFTVDYAPEDEDLYYSIVSRG